MKIGLRNFNLKNRIKTRTTAKVKRSVKGKLFPWYGKAGMGWIRNPKKAFYNLIYKRTTVSADEVGEAITKTENKVKQSKTSVVGSIFKGIGFTIWKVLQVFIIIFGMLVMIQESLCKYSDTRGKCSSRKRRKKY